MPAPRRILLPENFDKETALQLPTLSTSSILKIATASFLGGPAMGVLEFGLELAKSPQVALTTFTVANMTTIGKNLFDLLKTIKDFVGDSEGDAIRAIAAALGNPVQAQQIPDTAIAAALASMRRALTKPAGTGGAPPPAPIPFIDAYLEKKTLRTVTINITSHPPFSRRHTMVGGNETAIKLGFVYWKRGSEFVGQREWIETPHFLSVAPHTECDAHDHYFFNGVTGTVTEGSIPVCC